MVLQQVLVQVLERVQVLVLEQQQQIQELVHQVQQKLLLGSSS
jgi:hypothetical protein